MRCHILARLGQIDKAKEDFEEVACSEFCESKEIAEMLRDQIENLFSEVKIDTAEGQSKLDIYWRILEKRNGFKTIEKNKFSSLEDQLIQTLSEGPKSSDELIDALYSPNLDYETRKERLKQVLVRIRKKDPNLIKRIQGKYLLL